MKPHERTPSILAHLLSIPPLWGALFSAGVIHYYRESSRAVVFQARQAILVHVMFLALGLAGILARLLIQTLDTAFPDLGLPAAQLWLGLPSGLALFACYLVFPLTSALRIVAGHTVVYPLIGPRMWRHSAPDDIDEVYG